MAAAPHALIVIGSTGSASIADNLAQTAATIRGALVQRGFDASAIEILSATAGGPKLKREDVLEKLKVAQHLAATDEYWLVAARFLRPHGGRCVGVSGFRSAADGG